LARLYLDHNVSRKLVEPLRFAGHDVATARDLGLAAAGDERQLLQATKEARAVVTHNRADFTLLHDAWLTWPAAFGLQLPPHGGVLQLDHEADETLSQVLIELLPSNGRLELGNQLLWWRRRLGWYQRVVGAGWDAFTQGFNHPAR